MEGNASESVRQSAVVARTFIRLYAEVIQQRCGRRFVHNPRTANVKLLVSPTSAVKAGTSIGVVFVGGCRSQS